MTKSWLAALLTIFSLSAFAAAGDPVKVVYHMNEDVQRVPQSLNNIRNHLNADPKAKIVVVAHAGGVNFLKRGAADPNGNAFEPAIQELSLRGVEFRLCEYTLTQRKIDKKDIIDEVKYVPSGVAEVARLQSQEGYAYLKP